MCNQLRFQIGGTEYVWISVLDTMDTILSCVSIRCKKKKLSKTTKHRPTIKIPRSGCSDNYHKLSGLKEQKFILYSFGARVWNQVKIMVLEGLSMFLVEALGQIPFLGSSSLWWLLAFIGSWPLSNLQSHHLQISLWLVFIMFFPLCLCNTVMCHLMRGIRSGKCVIRRFGHCANIIQHTYTNPDGTAYEYTHLGSME